MDVWHLGADSHRRRHRQRDDRSLDGAAEQISAVLAMPPEYRIATAIRHLAALDARLRQRRLQDHADALDLREQIRSFTIGAQPGHAPVLEDK